MLTAETQQRDTRGYALLLSIDTIAWIVDLYQPGGRRKHQLTPIEDCKSVACQQCFAILTGSDKNMMALQPQLGAGVVS